MISPRAASMHTNGARQIALSSTRQPLDAEVHLSRKPPLCHNLSQTFPRIIQLQSLQGGICQDHFRNALFIWEFNQISPSPISPTHTSANPPLPPWPFYHWLLVSPAIVDYQTNKLLGHRWIRRSSECNLFLFSHFFPLRKVAYCKLVIFFLLFFKRGIEKES